MVHSSQSLMEGEEELVGLRVVAVGQNHHSLFDFVWLFLASVFVNSEGVVYTRAVAAPAEKRTFLLLWVGPC